MLGAAQRAIGAVLAAAANSRCFKPVVFLACMAPAVFLGWNTYHGDLGVDPVKTLLHETGETALFILLASLSVTPLRRMFRVPKLQNVRRMLGLWAFTYAVLRSQLLWTSQRPSRPDPVATSQSHGAVVVPTVADAVAARVPCGASVPEHVGQEAAHQYGAATASGASRYTAPPPETPYTHRPA